MDDNNTSKDNKTNKKRLQERVVKICTTLSPVVVLGIIALFIIAVLISK